MQLMEAVRTQPQGRQPTCHASSIQHTMRTQGRPLDVATRTLVNFTRILCSTPVASAFLAPDIWTE